MSNAITWMTLLISLGVFVVYPILSKQVPEATSFKPITPQDFVGLVGWLFAVALFVERAVEVVVMVFRDYQADLLDEAQTLAGDQVKELAGSTNASQADKDQAAKELADAHHQVVVYRAQTKEIALLVGFVFGLCLSLAGVRALHGLLADNASPGTLFTLADIVITGAMLAGGSEGIHRMTNAFSSVMDNVSTQADTNRKLAADKMKKS